MEENTGTEVSEMTTTPDEVADILHLPSTPNGDSEEHQEPGESEAPENKEETTTPPEHGVEGDEEPEQPKEEPKEESKEEPVETEALQFSLEIEDANGNKFTISPDDNLDEVLKEFEPKSNGQVLQLMRDLDKLAEEKSNFEKDQAEKTQAEETAKAVAQIQEGWDNEIKELTAQKRIPVGADGKPNERVQEVFKFMQEQNSIRAEKGMPFIQTIEDALDKLELQELKEAEAEKIKKAKEDARKNGALIGGSSAPATSADTVYKGGATTSAQALRSMGML